MLSSSRLLLSRTAAVRSNTLLLRSKTTGRPSMGVLVGDAGPFATHVYHVMNTFLIGAAPIYFILPAPKAGEGYSTVSAVFDKVFGALLSITLASHSWVGMNYVCTDYVPKISKSLVGPSRYFNAGMGIITLVGMGAIVFNDRGGIKGCLLSLWNRGEKQQKEEVAVTIKKE